MAQEATDQWRTDNGLKLPADAPLGTEAPADARDDRHLQRHDEVDRGRRRHL